MLIDQPSQSWWQLAANVVGFWLGEKTPAVNLIRALLYDQTPSSTSSCIELNGSAQSKVASADGESPSAAAVRLRLVSVGPSPYTDMLRIVETAQR